MGATDLEVLQAKFAQDEEAIKDDMARGTAKNYDDYRWQQGIIQGIRRCVGTVRDLEKAHRESEYEDT